MRDTGRASCSHSRSKELAGVDSAVLAKRARASKHCRGMSLLVQDLEDIFQFFRVGIGGFLTRYLEGIGILLIDYSRLFEDSKSRQPIPRQVSKSKRDIT